MDTGLIILILIFIFVFLGFCIGSYFHLCSQDHSKVGKITAPTEVVTDGAKISGKLTFVNRAGFTGNYYMEKCECTNQFKGRCVLCQGATFVDDDILGIAKTSSCERGNAPGFESPEVKEGDPMKLFFGKGNNTIL